MNSPCAFRRLLPALLILSVARIAPAEDWPTYRHDNRRSGAAQLSSSQLTHRARHNEKL